MTTTLGSSGVFTLVVVNIVNIINNVTYIYIDNNRVSDVAQNLRVHLAAVGFDPAVRITDPLISFRADKAYLFTNLKDNAQAAEKLAEVRRILQKKAPACLVGVVLTDVWDLYSCLTEYRKVFSKEVGNHVYVNVSTGSKIAAIAGMISCMLWNGSPYYAKLDYAVSHPEEVIGTDYLPVYEINRPSEDMLKVMSVIQDRGGRLSKKELIATLQSGEYQLIPSYGQDASKSAPHSKLRALLDPLEDPWKFVDVKAKGRHSEVSLTDQGKSALRIFGDPRKTT